MTDDPKPVVVQKSNWTTIVTIASISGIFIIFIVALWAAGFFTFSGSDPSSKIVAAALALVGGLVAAIVSIIGILLKYSIDQRTESRLAIESARAASERKVESERANALQTQAEQRLGLEAAIRAVELLGGPQGASTALQRTGALYALSNLNQFELTLNLTSYLLARGDLESNVACTLINRALKSTDDSIQSAAIMVLYENAERMLTPTGVDVPESIFYWDERLNPIVREWAPLALAKMLIGRPAPVWQKQFRSEAAAIAAVLGLAWQSEPDPRLKIDVGAILKSTIQGLHLGILYHPKRTLHPTQLMLEVKDQEAFSSAAVQMVRQLETWRSAP